jgi:nicotinic acid mononucleotide adenylyltransferase
MEIQYYLQQLSLSFDSSREEILTIWKHLPKHLKNSKYKLVIKALLDPYYHQMLFCEKDVEKLLIGGFFDDQLEPGVFDFQENFFCTPIHKILEQYEKLKDSQKPFVVMLNTGSYSPIHFGHLQMMELAYEKLSENYAVLGGYFSPSHDAYVSTKYNGTATYHSDARIDLCEHFVVDHPYLSVDSWEARYNDRAINFTNVILRLKKILKKYLPVPIQVAYVFGSDNKGFSWAFLKDDLSVCIERSGYELEYENIQKDQNLKPSRNYFINKKKNISSSKLVREGAYHFLSEKVKNLYFQFKNNQFPIYSPFYLIRDDSVYCSSIFPPCENFLLKFKSSLQKIYEESFSSYMSIKIIFLNVEKQNQFLNSSYFSDKHILNADLWTYHPNQISLEITRLFYLADGQISSNNLIPRLGKANIQEQVSKIQKEHLVFVDDDIASGKTVKMVQNLLQNHATIKEIVSLSEQSFYEEFCQEQSYQFHDIVDFRDFLMGSQEGGLTVQLPNGKIGKAPYVWPFVSLSHRAKIPHIVRNIFLYKYGKSIKNFLILLKIQ